jgi:hypothetical protein
MERGKPVPESLEQPSEVRQELARRRPRPKAARLPAPLEAQVARFNAPVRRELRRLIRTSPRFADLVEVFPGAAFAIASRQGSSAARATVLQHIAEGAPLKTVARKLELPMWLRRLPPEAFRRPLENVPGGEAFTRRIASRLPENIRHSSFWLESVMFATEAAHEEFAIWIADQPIYADRGEPHRILAVLAAYAWFSCADTKANEFIVVPWRPEIAFDTALCAAKSWLNRLRLVMQLETGALSDTWLEAGEVEGYRFAPLIDRDSLLVEAQAMQNCADQYAERLAREKCRLFSIQKNDAHVATLEVGPHARETGVLTITQLKARHNMPASIEIWQAAYAWMAQQSGLKRLPPMVAPDRPFNEKTWRAMMAPYRKCKNGAPWLPQRLSQSSFARLDMDMCDLARRAGVTSWLFT